MDTPLICAELSLLAYKDAAEIVFELERLNLNSFHWIENKYTDTQGFICGSETDVFISIRGTEANSFNDWKTNLDCAFSHCKFGEIHKGFHLDAMSVFYDIVPLLKIHKSQGKKIHLTGHSQGAGVAKQIAIELLMTGIDIDSFWGFGEPRSVSKDTAINLGERFPDIFNRVVNNNDIVTRLPTRLMGYSHFGFLHYFFEDGGYSPDPSAWTVFLDSIKVDLLDLGEIGLDKIKDHDMGGYLALMKVWDLK